MVVSGIFWVWDRVLTMETNPRWLRPCYDPFLPTVNYGTSDESLHEDFTEEDSRYIQRHIVTYAQECSEIVMNLKHAFTISSCLSRSERGHFHRGYLLTTVSI